ncbi:hypothetical protein [Microbacterium luticocti]|uniref:hypothetical protein n=1 Tax=Microbacterium luticocti TaxID=451764 RepID=UPI0003FDDBA0|nr:hypothetical protein [Microbacterium luticocti]
MRWDRFFEDLEDQLDSEWEAERAALDSEAERLRLSRLPLTERLRGLCGPDAPVISLELAGDAVLTGRVTAVGADWVGVALAETRAGAALLPVDAITGLGIAEADLLRSARADAGGHRGLSERMTLGFVLRDLTRRRVPVTLHLRTARALTGTIDRALADHLDLALHEPDTPRRSAAVTGMRIVPFAALAWVRLESPALMR